MPAGRAALSLLRRAGAAGGARPAGGRKGGGGMTVFVRLPGAEGRAVPVAVEADATAADVLAGLPASAVGMQLSFAGQALPPGALLADAGVGAEACLDAAAGWRSEPDQRWAWSGEGFAGTRTSSRAFGKSRTAAPSQRRPRTRAGRAS